MEQDWRKERDFDIGLVATKQGDFIIKQFVLSILLFITLFVVAEIIFSPIMI